MQTHFSGAHETDAQTADFPTTASHACDDVLARDDAFVRELREIAADPAGTTRSRRLRECRSPLSGIFGDTPTSRLESVRATGGRSFGESQPGIAIGAPLDASIRTFMEHRFRSR